ncbi:hemagglutinin/protease, zinc metalloprotease [Legionella busanensis]|uniref:Neutral metalloproteinase n=2 Tax=Legionella busanensis TaxID=190655 RepID=A0A378KA94_9GAMM|nr:hemagglutinin/protease, zinc metalloprotease [Legionella busanensis]
MTKCADLDPFIVIMIKKIIAIILGLGYSHIWAATYVNLYQAPLSHLNQFSLLNQQKTSSAIGVNDLKLVSRTLQDNIIITRYQQLYKKIPIIGAQVTVSKNPNASILNKEQVNGHLFEDIQLDTNPTLSSKQAIFLAKKSYANSHPLKTQSDHSELQIRANRNNQLQLVYLVSFKSIGPDNKPVWPFFVIDAKTGEISKQWNNIQTYSDGGPGGNEKVHEYWYGKDGLPTLEVKEAGEICTLEDEKVSLINVNAEWDWEYLNQTPVKYTCNNNVEDYVNGSFSAGNDAYYFGHTIINLFKDWYGLNVLQDEKGHAQKLIMRVHFGKSFDNAFWDGQTMSFGDGYYFYPLVSLDVAGHEVAHGFTQQHANLEYHDEPGALNESFSDMAAQASKAYLLDTVPQLYNKAYLTPNTVTWGMGETLITPSLPIKAIRFMDLPSLDGYSADCVDKKMARNHQSICSISYPELLVQAELEYPDDEDEKQSFIVHRASGVFNRAFYLMTKQLGIRTTFHIMIIANAKYWTPTTDFNEGACGVIYAARDLKINPDIVQSSFRKVGIDIKHCSP